MVTPELVSYIKEEFTKGKTREMIRATLLSEGGWNEIDLNDAFRTAIPMQNFTTNPSPIQSNPAISSITQKSPLQNNIVKHSFTQSNLMKDSAIRDSLQSSSAQKSSTLKLSKILLIVFLVVIVGGAGALWYFRPLLVTNTFNSLLSFSSNLFTSLVGTEDADVVPTVVDNTIIPVPEILPVVVRDCGTSASPDFKSSKTYKDNAVLNCLGNSALVCEDAKAILTNSLFPEIMEIVKDQNTNTCNFKLTYMDNSTLEDPNGNSFAGKYISCPLSIVKAIDETKPDALVFTTPTLADINKYASQIYFYGTLGVFMENNVDINKIQADGCTGNYINSVILSFQETQ